MTTQIDVLNAQIAQCKAQQASNTQAATNRATVDAANILLQNTQLDLQITNAQSQIATIQSTQGE